MQMHGAPAEDLSVLFQREQQTRRALLLPAQTRRATLELEVVCDPAGPSLWLLHWHDDTVSTWSETFSLCYVL